MTSTASRWPFPGDLPVERARQIAQTYRRALIEAHTSAAEAVDACARMAGEGWIDLDGEVVVEQSEVDIVTLSRAAELCGRSNRWIYKLVKINPWLIKRRRPAMVLLQDIQQLVAIERRKRAGGKSGAQVG